MRTEPVTFDNMDGQRLFGIVHEPQSRERRPLAVILLSPGTKYRVAPHRLNVKLARRFTAKGFVVLRFDFSGLGDSEGKVEEATIADFHGTVQLGRYVDDVCSAMDWMQREYKVSTFMVGGLCGGAVTGLLAGARDRRIHSLVGLGLSVLVDSALVDHTRYLTAGELGQWETGYLTKLRNVESWVRLLTFKSNYGVIAKVVAGRFRKQRFSKPTAAGNFNLLVLAALESFAATRQVLLIFGGSDRLHSIYKERLVEPYQDRLECCNGNIDTHVVKDANHIFSLPAWEEELWGRIDAWLARHYPPQGAGAALSEARTTPATS